jgi:hypothetical protein
VGDRGSVIRLIDCRRHRSKCGAAADVAHHTPIEKTLSEVTENAVRLIEGVDLADILLIKDGDFESLAATSPVATKVTHAQFETGEGPCLDAVDRT